MLLGDGCKNKLGLQRGVRFGVNCAARAADGGEGTEQRVGSLLMLPSLRALERFPYRMLMVMMVTCLQCWGGKKLWTGAARGLTCARSQCEERASCSQASWHVDVAS